MATHRTRGLRETPAPFVLQTSLDDFYASYQVNAHLEVPSQRRAVLAALHAQIQDAFNEYGVQIMSPNYRGDSPHEKVVPRDRWYLAPARPEHPGEDSPKPD